MILNSICERFENNQSFIFAMISKLKLFFVKFDYELSRPQHNCIYCGKKMTSSEQNRRHIKKDCVERGPLACACIFCGLQFPSENSLRVHVSRWCTEKCK